MMILLALLFIAPNNAYTPGLVDPTHVQEKLCSGANRNYPRHVTQAMKAEVGRLYGVPKADWPKYELDHRIPHAIGGADDVKNLWPQPLTEAHQKDIVEDALHAAVCRGKLSMKEAQRIVVRDWPGCLAKIQKTGVCW